MEQTFKPDKKYLTKVLWIQLTITVFVIIAIGIVHLVIKLVEGNLQAVNLIWSIGGLCILLMWILTTLIAKYWIKNLEYLVYEDRVKIHKGILTKTQQNIPFRAITDFALERTLYDRILGIGAIKIQTAGQSQSPTGYEGKLAGLIEYEKWYSELREKIKLLHPTSESITTMEKGGSSNTTILEQILNELKEIRKNTFNK